MRKRPIAILHFLALFYHFTSYSRELLVYSISYKYYQRLQELLVKETIGEYQTMLECT